MSAPNDPDSYAVRDRRWWTRDEDAAPAEPSRPSHVAALEAELADRERRLQELSRAVRDGQHELEQAKARIEREARREVTRRVRDVVTGWLGALDDLDRAIDAGRATAPGTALLEGVELVRANLLARLAEQGVRRIAPTGAPFDPRHHEAIARVPVADPARDGVVLETIAPGYLIGDELLRPARVAVGALG